jgi:hypothetical protein
MCLWTIDTLKQVTNNLHLFSDQQQKEFLELMNSKYPPDIYRLHLQKRRNALETINASRDTLNNATQLFPPFIKWTDIEDNPEALNGFALVFTAGGEGERLRLSLIEKGYDPSALNNFTKATFPLPEFYQDFGTLQTNLAMVSSFCKTSRIDIPVIVTTGPQGSITAKVIPEILREKNNFGLSNIRVIPQGERLHFTMDEKILCCENYGRLFPLTQPDETGGPLMMLKQKDNSGESTLDWLSKHNCSKLIVVQATALYDQRLLPIIANSLGNHDCLGIGILREDFPPKDPFGTFVTIMKENQKKLLILEQNVRNDATRSLKDSSGKYHLPFNTGFYAFKSELLTNNDLPDYATPPKETLPGYERSPKIGYAATDLLPLANDPIILAIEPQMFGVLKTADDLKLLGQLGKRFGLDKLCSTSG